MKNAILYIDTSNNKKSIVEIKLAGKKETLIPQNPLSSSQTLLPTIVNLLGKKNLSWEDIGGIEINPGPGSFTGLRVGITVANILGYFLDISINEVKRSVFPVYK